MKKIRKTLTIGMILLLSVNVKAQLEALEFLYGFNNDAQLLLEEYMRPYANIMGANLNAGWYNTAKPHKLGGFDITTTISLTSAPITALSYDLANLTELRAQVEGTSTIAPTIAGDMETLPELVYTTQITNGSITENVELLRTNHPNGIGVSRLPLPMAQLSLGLIKGTDVTVRFVPTIDIGGYGEIGVFGIGGRHSISQWIPVLKQLKFINISLQGGYTKIETAAHLNMQPYSAQIAPPNPPNFDDQFINMNLSGWTVNVIASQSIPVITVYEGIGYASSGVDLSVLGAFPVNGVITEPGPDFGKTTYTVSTDPIPEIAFDKFNNIRLNAGVRIKLAVLTIHYDFTRTSYSTHTAGIGISFR